MKPYAVYQTAHTLRGEGFDASEDGTGRGTPLVPVSVRDCAPMIGANYGKQPDSSDTSAGPMLLAMAPAIAVSLRGREGGATAELGDEVQNCLRASGGGGDKAHVLAAMAVRRLTPEECEALQGFPRSYTAVPHRGKPTADGPRYKALGNSWAIPCVSWIGQRIQLVEDLCISAKRAA